MTDEQKAAYVVAMAACANAEIAAMQLENQLDLKNGSHPRHAPDDFRSVINGHGIHHNAVLGMFHGG